MTLLARLVAFVCFMLLCVYSTLLIRERKLRYLRACFLFFYFIFFLSFGRGMHCVLDLLRLGLLRGGNVSNLNLRIFIFIFLAFGSGSCDFRCLGLIVEIGTAKSLSLAREAE